jgi:hypothetical protein
MKRLLFLNVLILKEGKIEEQLSGLKTPVVGNQTPQYTRFL